MDDATESGNQGSEVVVKAEQSATRPDPSVADLAASVEAVARKGASTLAMATDAHGTATDAKGVAADALGLAQEVRDTVESKLAGLTSAVQDMEAGAGLYQEIVNFLHRLFPGHGAPGTPSEPPR